MISKSAPRAGIARGLAVIGGLLTAKGASAMSDPSQTAMAYRLPAIVFIYPSAVSSLRFALTEEHPNLRSGEQRLPAPVFDREPSPTRGDLQ